MCGVGPGMNGIGSCRPLGNRKLTPVTHLGAWNALSGGSPKFSRRNAYPRGERMPEQILWRGSVLRSHDRAKAGVDRALGRGGAREARADDEDVGRDLGQRRHSVMKRVSRPE